MSTQLTQLNELLAAILPANRFYAAKLGECGPFESLEEFSRSVPFTTKDELAADHEAHPPYGTTHSFPLETYHRYHQTSGTRGKPLIWLDDADNWTWILDNWEWVWRGAGVNPGDTAFFPFSFGPFLGFWAGFEAATRMGVRAVPGGGLSSEDRLHLLKRSQSTILCCTPTYALRLAEVGEKTGMPVNSLGVEKVITCGEPGGSIPEVRARIEAAWHARVYDHHGMTEIGPVSVSSESDPDLLLLRHESYFCEVIDPDTGQPVAAGETGELVLTTLGRHGSPLLRYRTGDLVKPVPHGEHFALEGGVLARCDDMVVIRGINIHPSAIDAVVRSVERIGEYQVEVDQRTALPELRISAEGPEKTITELQQRLRSTFSLRIPVTLAPAGSLPTFEVKAKRWTIIK
ncbi:phenylacetate--CoA ligase family protein [Haloferula rosea]|uniref:AMP-binding protein n=1 Tax=Haloferula rosea TaxID=490093 RepID=A0A934RBX8_9BACT|nr:AMP-binding protein [Haloferula rosea]MBK1826782.1 AMP-binding protein [Haloferula rosea]